MHSSVETLDGNRVRLTIEVGEDELEPEIDAAFARIAEQARIPGFRPGRAPRRLVEVQYGYQAGRTEALRACLPTFYDQAVVEREVDAIASPEIEITSGRESGPVRFDAVVEVRPAVTVSGFDRLRVEIPNPVPPPDEIESEIQTFLRQFAELSTVSRSAVDGDHLRIDIHGTFDGEVIDGLTSSDYDYELGCGAVVPEIDQNLRGSSVGDILDFVAPHPDPDMEGHLRFRVLVKAVQETILPVLDDEFVAANSEYATARELRDEIYKRKSVARVATAILTRRRSVNKAIASLVVDDIPETLIHSIVYSQLRQIEHDLEQQGQTFTDYLESIGRSEDELLSGLHEAAEQTARLDLALRAVAAANGLQPDSDAIDAEIRDTIVEKMRELRYDRQEVSADDVAYMRERARKSGLLMQMKAGMSMEAAREWIDDRVVLVDPDGETIDPDLLELSDEDLDLLELPEENLPTEIPDR